MSKIILKKYYFNIFLKKHFKIQLFDQIKKSYMVKGVLKTLLKMNDSAPTKITRNLQKKYDSKYRPATLEQIKK
jgi:hypothetical protein